MIIAWGYKVSYQKKPFLMSILISIITVVRNGKADLEKTIHSLRLQTYQNIEYIVVDGLSSDGTLDVIAKNQDRINHWKSESDTGIYDAMNKGKDMATGDFVIFINAGDDFNTETVIADICEGMDTDLNKLYYGKVTMFNRDVEWEYKPYDNHDNKNYLPHHQSAFYPKSYYQQNSYDTTFKIMGDVDFTLRATKLYDKKYIPVTTIRSEMDGFGVNVFKNLKGVKLYIQDFKIFIKKHPKAYSEFEGIMIYFKAAVKYVAYKIGGTYLINKMIAQRLQSAGSTHNS
jgi:glycosyltransferase involved in cell wall biosynthesis